MKYNKQHNAIFSREEQLLNHLVLHANDEPHAIGLLEGKMGIALVVAHYARLQEKKQIEYVADFLVESIMEGLTTMTTLDFANGLSGIGWGVEYLIQNNYIKGCSTDILQNLDEKLMQTDVTRIKDWSIDKGNLGILHYVLYHLQGANRSNKECFDPNYLKSWQAALSFHEEWNKLLLRGINKETNFYHPELLTFVTSRSRLDKNDLSLKKGVAGALENLLLSLNKNSISASNSPIRN